MSRAELSFDNLDISAAVKCQNFTLNCNLLPEIEKSSPCGNCPSLIPSYLLINSTSLLRLYSLLILRNLDVSTGHFLTVVDTGERLPDQSCGLTHTRSCHCSFIWPVSPPGKQRFRERLCFPFTETIRIKMNEGLFLFFFFSGSSDLEGKRKRIRTFLKCGRWDYVSGKRW